MCYLLFDKIKPGFNGGRVKCLLLYPSKPLEYITLNKCRVNKHYDVNIILYLVRTHQIEKTCSTDLSFRTTFVSELSKKWRYVELVKDYIVALWQTFFCPSNSYWSLTCWEQDFCPSWNIQVNVPIPSRRGRIFIHPA